MEQELHPLLEEFISSQSYERGHSAGQEEVIAIASGLRYELRPVDNLINSLLEYKAMYTNLCR